MQAHRVTARNLRPSEARESGVTLARYNATMNELSRVAVWKVVDDLVTRVYRASAEIADPPMRELVREAVLSLGPLMPLPVLLRRLEVLAALLVAAAKARAMSEPLSETLRTAVAAGADALRRLQAEQKAAATP